MAASAGACGFAPHPARLPALWGPGHTWQEGSARELRLMASQSLWAEPAPGVQWNRFCVPVTFPAPSSDRAAEAQRDCVAPQVYGYLAEKLCLFMTLMTN